MKFKTTIRTVTALAVACSAGFCIKADELKPIDYSATTNTSRYQRITEYIPSKDTNFITGWKVQSTNYPVAIIHAVTWGRGTNAVFVLKTCEVLKVEETNGWQNAEGKWFTPATWVEGVK